MAVLPSKSLYQMGLSKSVLAIKTIEKSSLIPETS